MGLGDIISPDGGGLLQYPNFRGTLAKIREKTTPVLPTTINDIIFESEEYYKYTRTEEEKLFLQFDNKKPKRILIFMSQFGIDWLR